VKDVRAFEHDMNAYLDLHHKDLLRDLNAKQAFDDDIKSRLNSALTEFKAEFLASRTAAVR